MSLSLATRLLIGLSLLLSGCASHFTVTPSSDSQTQQLWRDHQSRIALIHSWALRGKIGVKTGEKGGSATLRWTSVDENQEIELYGPFGGGRIIITANDAHATLRDSKGGQLSGNSAEEVLYRHLGWKVPFNELLLWSRGLPNPGAANLQLDRRGLLKSLEEGIWSVDYQEYQRVDNTLLPKKMTIHSRAGAMEVYDRHGKVLGDTLSVKLIFRQWGDIVRHTDG